MIERNPIEAYRRVDFDARIATAAPNELVLLCYDEFVISLGSAMIAEERSNNLLKSKSITRALAALTALQMGISSNQGIGGALNQLYEAARRTLLDSVLTFDRSAISTVRQDFLDISRAMAQQSQAA